MTGRMTGAGASETMPVGDGSYRGARGLDPHVLADIRRMFGFDKPAPERFVLMLRDYLSFDFGRSFFRDQPVLSALSRKKCRSRSPWVCGRPCSSTCLDPPWYHQGCA